MTVKFRVRQEFEKVWLRVTKRGHRYTFSTSLDGKTFVPLEHPASDYTGLFQGTVVWGDESVKQVGFLAINDSTLYAPENDASFDFFEMRAVSGEDQPTEEHVPTPGGKTDVKMGR